MGYGVKTRVVYKDFGLERILAVVAKTSAAKLRVGVVGPKANERTADGRLTNAENAAIQQYGLAPKHYQERDFLDKPFKDARTEVASILRRVMGRVVRLKESPEQAMDWAGGELQKIARDAIYGPPGILPRNKPATVEKKGFDHPLIDHLDLVQAISHRVVRSSGDSLESGSALGDYEAFEIGGG